MPSVIDLCNSALIDLGADTIMSLNEASEEARLCSARYASCRDFVLRQHRWNSATFQAQLARHSSAPLFGYSYRYALPVDPYCLRVWEIKDGHGFRVARPYLETDAESVLITYAGRVDDPNQFDSILAEAISASLAAAIAYKLTGSSGLRKEMWSLYLAKLAEAKNLDGLEGDPTKAEPIAWVDARL
jgi:hypothetical protein